MAAVTSNHRQLGPDAVYGNPNDPTKLRIATGGAGQSGLLQALAAAFIATREQSFAIEWYTSHTSESTEYLRNGVADVAITYYAIAEYAALDQGIVDRVEYAWRDHWILIGPKDNPAKLSIDGKSTIYALFTKLYGALEAARGPSSSIKFLSRYDRSACHIKESAIWSTIGQTPWAEPAPWYHMARKLPFEALLEAIELEAYTITDYGTWCAAIGVDIREKLTIFAQGGDDEEDPLLNPAHLLVATQSPNKDVANDFTDWMNKADGGQRIVRSFEKNGMKLYSSIPSKVDPLGQAKMVLFGSSAGDVEKAPQDPPETR